MEELALLDQDDFEVEEEVEQVEEYKFSEKQDQFIYSPAKYSGYGGGVGNGKSFAGCVKTYNHCTEQPGAFFLVGRRHAIDLIDSTQKDFLALFQDEGSWSEKLRTFTFANGSEVIFRHLDDLKKLTNMNLSGFWIDQAEEVPEAAFNHLNGRIRRKKGSNGKPINRREGFVTYNMDGRNWIWRRFHKKRDVTGEPLKNAESYENIVATSLENPNLPADYIENLLAMPEEWVKRFVYGSWDSFAGQIFSEWNPTVHVVDPFVIPNHWQRYRSIDHGQNNPTACLWAAIDYDGNVFVYQEYYQPDAPVSEHVKNIKQMSQVKTTDGNWVMDDYEANYIDPSTHGKTRESQGKKFSVADEYYEAGIMTTPAQNDVLAGINRVKEYLRVNPKRWHPTKLDFDGAPIQGAPKIFVFANCVNLIEEMGQYKWKPQRYGAEEDPKAAPVKKQDHAVDALRYFLMTRPQSPDLLQSIDPRIMQSPIELARYCHDMGMSVEDFMVQRYRGNQNAVNHASTGISHADSDISHTSSFNS